MVLGILVTLSGGECPESPEVVARSAMAFSVQFGENCSYCRAVCGVFCNRNNPAMVDLEPSLKAWLAAAFMHHWVGRGTILTVVVFLLVFVFLRIAGKESTEQSLTAQVRLLSWITTLGAIIIFGFFLYETFGK